jgi:GcrA cell cycle regulator
VEDAVSRPSKSANPWWTPERRERLQALWFQQDPELGMPEIATELGCTINQLAGMINRYPEWPKKPDAVARRRAAIEAARGRPVNTRKSRQEAPPPPALPPRPPTLVELGVVARPPEPDRRPAFPGARARTCQWPIGEPGRNGFRFCGCETTHPRLPYCDVHAATAIRPRQETAA